MENKVWNQHAKHWDLITTPLKPAEEDIQRIIKISKPILEKQDNPKIVTLGITPELVSIPFVKGAIYSFDASEDMIKNIYRPNEKLPSFVQEAYWQELSLEDNSIDLILGDGSLNALPEKNIYFEVLKELSRTLKKDGKIIIRVFCRPDVSDFFNEIKEDVLSKKITNFHALKWKIAMALNFDFSVPVKDIYMMFNYLFPDREKLSIESGWSLDVINTIDAYKDSSVKYTFPTLNEITEIFSDYFDIENIFFSSYELGERTPTFVLKVQE